ncbi:MAG: 30S ribosomal protein S2 [Candidatus Jorgensenbacteria bacterium]
METVINEDTLKELTELGVIYGHKKSKTHPLMKPIVIDNRNEIELLNPEAIIESLNRAVGFIKEKTKEGALVLFVGTTPAAKDSLQAVAEEFSFPYVVSRWLGGTITNFKVIHKRIAYYSDLKSKKEKGELAKYTKKEQLNFDKEIEKMRGKFEGLLRLVKTPDVLFVVDIKEHDTAVREANQQGIPVVALVDNDDDPTVVQYPIYGSDHSKKSIDWVVSKVREALSEARAEIPAAKKENENE